MVPLKAKVIKEAFRKDDYKRSQKVLYKGDQEERHLGGSTV